MAKWLEKLLKQVLQYFKDRILKDMFQLFELLDKIGLKHKYSAPIGIILLFRKRSFGRNCTSIGKRIEEKNL